MSDILITHVHWHTTCLVYEQAQQHLLRKLTICAHTTAVQHMKENEKTQLDEICSKIHL